MQVELLKNVVAKVVGQQASGIVDLLHNKKNVNESLISKKLKMTINQVRNILYRLADEGIVSFTRKKDRKKGGWYIYFWTLNSGKGLGRFREHLEKELENLNKRLEQKRTQRFYYCPNCQVEVNEENALLHNYTCPECGEVMQIKEKAKEVEMLEKEITKLQNLLANVNKEIEEIEKVETIKKNRRIRAEEKKRAKERAAKKKAKEKELAKLKRLKNKTRKKRNSNKDVSGKTEKSDWKKKLRGFFR